METQKGHQALGTSFHLVLEKVPKGLPYPTRQDTNASEEEWDKAKQLADIALPLLPPDPKSRILREHGIRMDTYPGGPTMVGYIDLAIPTGIGWPSLLVPANEAVVGDYKTLSDFRYMKTPEELANSVQMMTYAKWAVSPGGLFLPPDDLTPMLGDLSFIPPENGTVRLLHLYARTKAPYSRSSIRHESAIVGTQQIEDFWGKTLDTVREMEQVAKCGSSDDVEAGGALNGHCEAYGGCHYRDKCGIAKESSIKTLFQIGKKPTSNTPPTPTQETQNMSGSSILAKIQAARAAAQGLTTPTAPAAANSPATTPATSVGSNVGESQQANVVVGSAQTGTVVNPGTDPQVTNPSNQPSGHVTPTGPFTGLMAKIAAQGKGTPTLQGSAAQAYGKEQGKPETTQVGGSGELLGTVISSVGDLMKLAQGIVPPDAPPRTQAVITRPGDKVVDPEADPVVAEGNDEDGESDSSTSNASGNVPSSVPVSTQVAGKRGRPTKAEMEAKAAAEKAKFDALVEAEVQKRLAGVQVTQVTGDAADLLRDQEKDIAALQRELEAAHNTRAKLLSANEELTAKLASASQGQTVAPATAPGPTLYIDCYPVKGKHEKLVDFFEWIGPIATAVAQSNGVADYRLIQYNSKGLLASYIRDLVKLEGMPEAMTIPSFAAGADVALEILTPMAKQVIKKL